MDELCRLYVQTEQTPLPDFCTSTPSTCAEANGLLWCYNYDTCGLACDDVCSALGMNVIVDDKTWFEAQNTYDECANISEAFGLGRSVELGSFLYACIEDSGGPHDVPGLINSPLSCSTFSSCPELHRTNMDKLGLSCENNESIKSVCPCE